MKGWIRKRTRAGLAGLLLALATGPVRAEGSVTEARFDLVLLGMTAGHLHWSADEGTGRYTLRGRMETSGLAGVLRRVVFDAVAEGRLTGEELRPARYAVAATMGRRAFSAELAYARGVPRVVRYDPPPAALPDPVDPATQGGTVDPLTALHRALRDAPPERACRLSLDLFDGRRAARLTLAAPQLTGDGATCAGEYRRIAGYSPEDMAERDRFPFTLHLTPLPDGSLRVDRVEMETIFGPARLVRRPDGDPATE